MGLVEDFERVLAEGERLEGTSVPLRLKRRIANAYARAIEKALTFVFEETVDPERLNRTLFRHAERGIRDFVP